VSLLALLAVSAALTLASSVHCAGMCGPLVLLSAPAPSRAARLLASLLLHAGKAATYLFLGAAAGLCGQLLARNPRLSWTASILPFAAAGAIALAGLSLLGVRVSRGGPSGGAASLWLRIVGPLLKERPPGTPLFLGMAMGLLPCPLVTAAVVSALASGTPLRGVTVMAGLALGTSPALGIVAALGKTGEAPARGALAKLAGILLIAASLALPISRLR
jgi:sulfite exporter TauE/SafE